MNSQTPFETWLLFPATALLPSRMTREGLHYGVGEGAAPPRSPTLPPFRSVSILPDRCLPNLLLRTSGDRDATFPLGSPSQYSTALLLKLFFLHTKLASFLQQFKSIRSCSLTSEKHLQVHFKSMKPCQFLPAKRIKLESV